MLPSQIWSKLIKVRPTYGDFSIFQDGGRRDLAFSNCVDFKRSQRSRWSNCVPVPNFVEIGQTAAEIWRLFDFSKMAAVRHLGFVMRVFGPPTKGIWWSLSNYHCAKFGWNRCSSFGNMHVFSISRAWLENAYSRQNGGSWGILPPKWGAISSRLPKDTNCCRNTSCELLSVKIALKCGL